MKLGNNIFEINMCGMFSNISEISADMRMGFNPDDHLRPDVFRNLTG